MSKCAQKIDQPANQVTNSYICRSVDPKIQYFGTRLGQSKKSFGVNLVIQATQKPLDLTKRYTAKTIIPNEINTIYVSRME